MFHFSASLIAQVLQGVKYGDDVAAKGVVIDSRQVQAGNVFFAIPGERCDPHAFLHDVKSRGASCAVVQSKQAIDLPQIVVTDSFKALGKLANFWRQQFYLPLIALTGSNGKTSLKNMIATILKTAVGEQHVLYTLGNYNSGFGLPLTLLRLGAEHHVGVIEMGMSSLGEIDYITRIAKPQVAVINNVYPAHVEFLGSLENIAKAKAEIFNGLDKNGIAVLNRDDQFYDYWRECTKEHRQLTFGLHAQATITASEISSDLYPSFTLHTPLGSRSVQLQVMGRHNIMNALAATAACIAVAVPLDAIVAGLQKHQASVGRLRELKFANDVTVIDDAYNANPASVRAAIDVLAKHSGAKLLVLGDMKELGDKEIDIHQEIGEYALQSGIDNLFSFGDLAAFASDVFADKGQHFESLSALQSAVEKRMQAHSTILLKGSNSMGLHKLITALQK